MDITSNAGPAVFSALCLAGLAVIGSYTFSFVAWAFFSVAEATAGGQNDVTWPDEPLLDRFGRGLALSWLMLVSLVPAFIMGRIISGDRTAAAFSFALCGFGVVFPIVVMSAQSALSPMIVFYPPAIARMWRRPGSMAGYYVASIPVYVAAGVGLYGLHAWPFYLAPLFAAVVAWVVLTQARLYGRLALIISRVPGRPHPTSKIAPHPLASIRQRDLPDVEEEGDQYGLRATNAPLEETPDRPGLKRLWIEDDDDGQPIGFADEPLKPLIPEAMLRPSEKEIQLAGPRRTRLPARPWTNGTYTFALRLTSFGPLLWMTTGITVSSWMWRPIAMALRLE
ncbi:MAG: hypothetical protein ACJ8C4_00920 [Gemmataceae bacterium]